MSLPRALLLALALLQAFGITELVRRTNCEEECKRDGCKDDCMPGDDAPNCPCHCPSAATMAPPVQSVVKLAPLDHGGQIEFHTVERFQPSPDPREILHVPRSYAV